MTSNPASQTLTAEAADVGPRRSAPLVLAGLVGALAPPLLAVGPPQPLRLVLTLALLGWAPGFAVVRLAGITEPFLLTALSVAVSVGVTIAAAVVLLYAGGWGTTAVLVAVGTVTVLAVVVRLPWWRAR